MRPRAPSVVQRLPPLLPLPPLTPPLPLPPSLPPLRPPPLPPSLPPLPPSLRPLQPPRLQPVLPLPLQALGSPCLPQRPQPPARPWRPQRRMRCSAFRWALPLRRRFLRQRLLHWSQPSGWWLQRRRVVMTPALGWARSASSPPCRPPPNLSARLSWPSPRRASPAAASARVAPRRTAPAGAPRFCIRASWRAPPGSATVRATPASSATTWRSAAPRRATGTTAGSAPARAAQPRRWSGTKCWRSPMCRPS
mmetsp:Transcript_14136/g.33697  ORF Transcript_14136/g.33697 Transcript_14136/m.33697 type:complete len:251 (+) Transcript_14136:1014-1766(+)